MYKLIIFDMDGTILNTLEDLYESVNYILNEFSFPTRTIEEVRCFVGNGIYKLIERAVPKDTAKETIDEVFEKFIIYYKEHCSIHTKPYDGINELLNELKEKGYKLAVVSNKADSAVKILAEDYFTGLFDDAIGERKGIQRKPSPDSVLALIDEYNVDKQETLYIGDSEVDIQTANNAHIDYALVKWGFRDEEFLYQHGASHIFASCEELKDYIYNH